ncbi:MAG: hypothetical protein J5767_12455 [Paludibacteraceae bacterium]|nr:hypothetical protein [Paludibacteraceae bacterium]
MANIVTCTYIFHGPKSKSVEKLIHSLENSKKEIYLDDIVVALFEDPYEYCTCNGKITNIRTFDDKYFGFEFDCRWNEPDDFKDLLLQKFKGLKIEYFVEDPANDSYYTNSDRFNPELILVESGTGCKEYFSRMEDAEEYALKLIGVKRSDKHTDVLKELDKYNNKEEHMFSNVRLHVFDYFDD